MSSGAARWWITRERRWGRRGWAVALVCAASLHGTAARATTHDSAGKPGPGAARETARGVFLHGYVASALGDGLRLNNPYRLAEPLGDDAESLSRSAFYLNVAGGLLFGDPLGWQHGAQLDLSLAMEGIPQEVLTTSYVLYRHLNALFSVYGRVGLPLVLEPDTSLGVELAAGSVLALRGGVGVSFELLYSQFYGAATQDESVTVIPIISAQLGLRGSYEVLP